MIEVYSSSSFLGYNTKAIYKLLRFTGPKVSIDVGAASGHTTKLIRANSDSIVHAFEPFPNNIKFFEEMHSEDAKVVLHKCAASDVAETVSFNIPKTVKGNVPGWETMQGYASGGYIGDRGKQPELVLDIDAVKIDDVVSTHKNFVKIDVQGHELNVLRGMANSLERAMVDLLFVEFSGSEEIIEYMDSFGYITFDTPLILIARSDDDEIDWSSFEIVGRKPNSSGKTGYNAYCHNMPRHYRSYCERLRELRKDFRTAETDLIFISPSFLPEFLRASASLIEGQMS